MNRQFYGWKLTVVLWGMAVFVLGFASYGGPIMNTFMITELQLDRKSLALANSAFSVCMGLVSPLAGYAVSRWGGRATISAGILLAGLGSLALATVVSNVVGVVIAYGAIIGSATALGGHVPANAVIGYWFRKRLALALAIVSTGTSVGGFIASPLLTKVIVATGGNWRAGWFVIAATCAIAFIAAILFVRNKPSDVGQLQDGTADDRFQKDSPSPKPASRVYKTEKEWIFRDAMRNPIFWMMILSLGVSTSVWGILVGHGMAFFRDLGHPPATGAVFLSCLISSGLGGKALFAALGDRIEPRFLWSASLFAIAAAMLMVANTTSPIKLYAYAIVLGSMAPVGTLSMFTLTANYYGKTVYASLMGVIGLFMALLPSSVGYLAGMVFDRFGSYWWAFNTHAGIAILAALVLPFAITGRRTVARLDVALHACATKGPA
ncbi:MAG: MFS transporter [Candidatus Binatia bacterium]